MIAKFTDKRLLTMLNEWYTAMGRRQFDLACSHQEKINQHLPKMKKNTKLWIRYRLFFSRFQLLFEKKDGLEALFSELKAHKDVMDHELTYYFYFFKGLFDMVNAAPNRAVCRFKEAEQHLPAINDRIEAAEFYYKTAGAYYMMKSPPLSIQYVTKALQIYQNQFGYIKKILSCQLLLAVNYIDEARYEEAEQLFNDSIKKTVQINDNNLLCHAYYNYGFLKTAEKKDKEALRCYKKVLKNQRFEEESPVSYLHCVYEAVRSFFKTGSFDEGHAVLQKGLDISEKVQSKIMKLKLITLETLYTSKQDPYDKLQKLVLELEKIEAWVDLEVLLEDITEYYKKKGDFEKAAFFIMRG
ncbi:aspartate phosphatase [Bacillus nakamurai]|uniref:response regulator aspartate phosphatase n=1 Tax=Bacillus nakamurai TaxID=1793963 RepID=UPI00077859CC|nr:tetratricopeptide repeat protein [Bacillus nakamurai]KXZ20615.1 aspartate phosphatase [Bacillus nakamurai]MCC9022692.1 tetratricopeptide repeat protein [Bacillus nakamurai]